MQDVKKVRCNKEISKCSVSSPVGLLNMAVCHFGIHKIQFGRTTDKDITETVILIKEEIASPEGRARLEECLYWFRQYFERSSAMKTLFGPPVCRTIFQNSFQHRVLQVLRQQVTFGKVISYGALAQLAGKNKKSAIAVGRAMSSNNIPIVIPCHRVVNRNRKIGKFSAGTPLKTWLLKHEGNDVKDGEVFMTSETDEQQSTENSTEADTTIDMTSQGNVTGNCSSANVEKQADMTVAIDNITKMDTNIDMEMSEINIPENNTNTGFETKEVSIPKSDETIDDENVEGTSSQADVNSTDMTKQSDMNVDVEVTDAATGANENVNSDSAKEDNVAETNINVLTTTAKSTEENVYVDTDSAKEKTNETDMNINVKICEGICMESHVSVDTEMAKEQHNSDDVVGVPICKE